VEKRPSDWRCLRAMDVKIKPSALKKIIQFLGRFMTMEDIDALGEPVLRQILTRKEFAEITAILRNMKEDERC
jgi:hypothetical protein